MKEIDRLLEENYKSFVQFNNADLLPVLSNLDKCELRYKNLRGLLDQLKDKCEKL